MNTSLLHAARALEIALCQHCNGTFNTLAWVAAGQPDDVDPSQVEVYQQARAIIHGNGGKMRPGDAERLLSILRDRRERGGE